MYVPGYLLLWDNININSSFSQFGSKKSTFPAQRNDTKATVQWIHKNAKNYNLNSNFIGVWGASAGAQLAGLLGTVSSEQYIRGLSVWRLFGEVRTSRLFLLPQHKTSIIYF